MDVGKMMIPTMCEAPMLVVLWLQIVDAFSKSCRTTVLIHYFGVAGLRPKCLNAKTLLVQNIPPKQCFSGFVFAALHRTTLAYLISQRLISQRDPKTPL